LDQQSAFMLLPRQQPTHAQAVMVFLVQHWDHRSAADRHWCVHSSTNPVRSRGASTNAVMRRLTFFLIRRSPEF